MPEAIDWLAGLTLPAGIAPAGRTHPTFVEIGTNRPLYVHREGSNVINGRYYVNYDPAKTIGHYSAFRRVDIAGLRKLYDEARALSPADATRGSPLVDATAPAPMRFLALDPSATESPAEVIGSLGPDGAWIAPLEYISHPYRGDGPKERPTGDFSHNSRRRRKRYLSVSQYERAWHLDDDVHPSDDGPDSRARGDAGT